MVLGCACNSPGAGDPYKTTVTIARESAEAQSRKRDSGFLRPGTRRCRVRDLSCRHRIRLARTAPTDIDGGDLLTICESEAEMSRQFPVVAAGNAAVCRGNLQHLAP